MEYFMNDFRFGIGRVFPRSLQIKVVQEEKLSDFDAYGLEAECMELIMLLEIKLIHLYVTDTGEIYSIDADTFMKFAEVRSIGNDEPIYCCPLSHWSNQKE